jgi:hypothetical protein
MRIKNIKNTSREITRLVHVSEVTPIAIDNPHIVETKVSTVSVAPDFIAVIPAITTTSD